MKVVSFSIFKGGTGKTTSAVNTAAALVKRGKKVLLVDLDQQASATRYLGLNPEESRSMYDVFMGTKPAQLAIRQTSFGIDVLTSNGLMAAIEEALEPGDEVKVAEFLTPLRNSYDFILIDTPPGKAMLAFNGLAAADLIVIAASAQRMAVDGVADLITYVQGIMWNIGSRYASGTVWFQISSELVIGSCGKPHRVNYAPSTPSREGIRSCFADNVVRAIHIRVDVPPVRRTVQSALHPPSTEGGDCR
jgi:AAA domain-containing protein